MQSQYKFAIRTAQGGRDENQDFAACEQYGEMMVAVVCDGMGGTKGGQIASALATESVLDAIEESFNKTPITQQVVQRYMEQANYAIWQKSRLLPNSHQMGTTMAIIVVEWNNAIIAHVGDTRIYHIREKKIIFHTKDHTKAFQLTQEGKMTQEEARLSPSANVITRALGVLPTVQSDIKVLLIEPGDIFLICTDGVWRTLGNEIILASLHASKDVSVSADYLIREADRLGIQEGYKHDNMTVAVVQIGKRPSPTNHSKQHSKNLLIIGLSFLLLLALILLILMQ